MTNTEKLVVGLGFLVLFGAVVVFGVMLKNINDNLKVIDQKGQAMRSWAATTATWAKHVSKDHLASLEPTGIPWDHIQPPPDPPPPW